MVPRNRRATEGFPKTTRFWEVPSPWSDSKTDPTPVLVGEDDLSKCITETDLGNCVEPEFLSDCGESRTSIIPFQAIIDPVEREDPESDTSSGSGQSISSASTPASRNAAWGGDNEAWDGPVPPKDCSHMPYASHMRMSEFRREQTRFNWETLSQAIASKLYPHWPQAQTRQRVELLYYLRHIGQGGSSSVYAAAFEGFGLDDTLAVKIIEVCRHKTAPGLPTEFQIMQGLRHNHIVAFVSSFAQEDKFGVLMYPLAPYNLAQYLHQVSEYNLEYGKPHQPRVNMLLRALGCLSSALLYLHVTQNIKHKDIKPENILVDRHGSVLLTDFGISKQYEGNTVTSGPTPFTEKYAAPEVAAQDSRDLSADTFSLGCVFLEIATVILGESLNTLHRKVFDGSGVNPRPKQAYCHSLPEVKHWVCHLKEISLREEWTWEDRSYSSISESGRVWDQEESTGKHSLQEQHLDMILFMMSESPAERPSMKDLYQHFKKFALDCSECRDTDSHSECGQSRASRAQSIGPITPLTGRKLTDNGQQPHVPHSRMNSRFVQPREKVERRRAGTPSGTKMITNPLQVSELRSYSPHQLIIRKTLSRQSSHTSLATCSYSASHCDRLPATKVSGNLQSASGEHEEDDYSSEAETCYSDSEISNDEELVADSVYDDLAAKVKSCVFSRLESKYLAGLFNCWGPGESAASGREGSASSTPPAKRRSMEQSKSGRSSQGDDPKDGGDEPDERFGQNTEEKLNTPLQSRKWFACQFFQRDSNRCEKRSCSGPGWRELHRLKEHLTRTHRIYRCERCQEVFRKSEDLRKHRREEIPCDLRGRDLDEEYDWGQGFDEDQARKLLTRTRKRKLTEVSDEQKWGEWYKILFPTDHEIPSPYYNDETNSLISNLAEHLSVDIRPLFSERQWPLVESRIRESIDEFTLRRLQPLQRGLAQYPNSPGNQTGSIAQTISAVQRSTVATRRLQNPQHLANFGFGNEMLRRQQLNRVQHSGHGNETIDSACYMTFDPANVSSGAGTAFEVDEPVTIDECADPETDLWLTGAAFQPPHSLLNLPNEFLANPSSAEEQSVMRAFDLDGMGSSQQRQNRY